MKTEDVYRKLKDILCPLYTHRHTNRVSGWVADEEVYNEFQLVIYSLTITRDAEIPVKKTERI